MQPDAAALDTGVGLRGRWRIAVLALSALAFAVALLRPGVDWPAPAAASLAVVDITQSMNVPDMRWQGETVTRLAYARALLGRTLEELPCGYRLGVAVFTERKTLPLMAPVEVCGHRAALADVIGGIDSRMAWAADSHLHYGVHSGLDEVARRWPGTALAFFTDGHQAPSLVPGREPRFQRSAGTPPGWLFGVGGTLPQPVPKLDAAGRVIGYWTAEDAAAFASTGEATLSVLDMERLGDSPDPRNAAQRPAGAQAGHLSARGDAVLDAIGRSTGLGVQPAHDARSVAVALVALPSRGRTRLRVELHGALVAFGALAVLSTLWPARGAGHPRNPSSSHPDPA